MAQNTQTDPPIFPPLQQYGNGRKSLEEKRKAAHSELMQQGVTALGRDARQAEEGGIMVDGGRLRCSDGSRRSEEDEGAS